MIPATVYKIVIHEVIKLIKIMFKWKRVECYNEIIFNSHILSKQNSRNSKKSDKSFRSSYNLFKKDSLRIP